MKRYSGTQIVDPGVYLNLRRVCFRSVGERGALPGRPSEIYRKVPAIVLLVAAPPLGLAYVLFLPFIAFAMIGWLLARAIVQLAARTARSTAAHLTSKPYYVVPLGPTDEHRRASPTARPRRHLQRPTSRAA